jgi:phosphoribosylformylglycinamidine synthase
MANVNTLIVRCPGTNCDEETAYAFQQAGSSTELVHIKKLTADRQPLADFQILAFPGGFSYGDDLGAGKVAANEISLRLCREIEAFVARGGLVIGICNGFQILVKAGLLPGPISAGQSVTLTNNDSGRFECRWVHLKAVPTSSCIFTRGIEQLYLPVAHGEGKLVAGEAMLSRLNAALLYCDESGHETAVYPANPNGSMRNIAGMADDTGRIFSLMPHPERHIRGSQHPRWPGEGLKEKGDGLRIFTNAVEWASSL